MDDWRPTASLAHLKKRAVVISKIRAFFASRSVLEVETPLLARGTTPDPHISSISVQLNARPGRRHYLQTSPEFAMKRLLAAGSGPIYQLGKAFREDEIGRWHQCEFTMLEWYRPGFDDISLMNEVDELLVELGSAPAERWTYRAAFTVHAGVDPFTASDADLVRALMNAGVSYVGSLHELPRDVLLDLIMSHLVSPNLGRAAAAFVHDYPVDQAAYARVKPGATPVAARFELFAAGLEIANGYFEVTDPVEQRKRFERQNALRRARALPEVPIDERLLAALGHGMADCAGVALGVDRLLGWWLRCEQMTDVIAFGLDNA